MTSIFLLCFCRVPGVGVGLHAPDVILDGCRVYGDGTAIASVRPLPFDPLPYVKPASFAASARCVLTAFPDVVATGPRLF